MGYRHLFGPVLSRRLGVSLGVDLTVHKVCSLDCIYCECGHTTNLTLERKPYVSFGAVQKELDHYWAHHDDPDYITFSGSGEPALNIGMGRVITYIKDRRPDIRVAVLTNATLLFDPNVREELARADLVVPSLDAVSSAVFRRINRPCEGIDPDDVVSGIETFTARYTGQVWLEIFILPGINDTREELARLKQAVKRINPHKTQLNTLDRPGTVPGLSPVTREEMERVVAHLGLKDIEVIAQVGRARTGRRSKDLETAVMEAVFRRPCTLQDLASMFGQTPGGMEKLLFDMKARGRIESGKGARGNYFRAKKQTQ